MGSNSTKYVIAVMVSLLASPCFAQTFPGLAGPNTIVAGPPSGGLSALPVPRAMVNADLPVNISISGVIQASNGNFLTNGVALSNLSGSPDGGLVENINNTVALKAGASGIIFSEDQFGSPFMEETGIGSPGFGYLIITGTGTDSTSSIAITATKASTSPTTGALTIAGGLGVSGATTLNALTSGIQEVSQGGLTLANTAAGAFGTTIKSSNSASAAASYILPVAPPGGNGYALTSTTAGVWSWTNPSSFGGPCTTTANSIQYDNAGAFGCISTATWDGTNLILGGLNKSGSNAGTVTINGGNVTSAASSLLAGDIDLNAGSSDTWVGGNVNITGGTSGIETGGEVTITAGTSTTTGAGGNVSIVGGASTTAPGFTGTVGISGGSGNGVSGGAVDITGGTDNTGTNGGGEVRIFGGVDQGAATGAEIDVGPDANITGGIIALTGGDGAGGGGGHISMDAGSDTANGAGGGATLLAGDSSGTGAGGLASLSGGNSITGGGGGGEVDIIGGNDGGSGNGGSVNILAGSTVTGFGGGIQITAADSGSSHAGGSVGINAGAASTGIGGEIDIIAGNATAGSAAGGNVVIEPGTSFGGTPGVTQLEGTTDVLGQLVFTFGTPTIASGACGSTTNGTLAAGSVNQSGEVIIASATTTSCTISFSATLAAAPKACMLEPGNAQAATELANSYVSAITTGHWVITGTALASTDYYYHCI